MARAGASKMLTSALSKPLQVASPDWASLYSASFELSMLGPPAKGTSVRVLGPKQKFILFALWGDAYPSARRFSRRQSSDSAPRSKWHGGARRGRPSSVSCRPSRLPGKSAPRLQREDQEEQQRHREERQGRKEGCSS